MNTDDLIRTLAAGSRPASVSLSAVWWSAAGLAVALAGAVFFAALDPRPDIAAAAQTPRFLFKFVVTAALAGTAFGLVRALSRPGEIWRDAAPFLAIGPVLIAIGVGLELLLLPLDMWASTMIGSNSMVCLTFIPLIGIGPLAIFLLVLRRGAPTRPALAGAVAGLLAGGIAATLYAAHCDDDSPLFVVIWYSLAIAGLSLAGAAGARFLVRW